MSVFDVAVERTLKHEGGYVEHPADPGGATNWGISARFLKRNHLTDDIATMTRERAVEIYREYFWEQRFEAMPEPIACRLFDISVNAGARTAARVLQRAIRAASGDKICPADDGIIGKQTISAALSFSDPADIERLMIAMRAEQAGHYRALVRGASGMGVFLKGWLARAYSP